MLTRILPGWPGGGNLKVVGELWESVAWRTGEEGGGEFIPLDKEVDKGGFYERKGVTVSRNPLELLVAGTGFEPVTFGL